MKNLQQKVCIFCAETVKKIVRLLLEENVQLIFFMLKQMHGCF